MKNIIFVVFLLLNVLSTSKQQSEVDLESARARGLERHNYYRGFHNAESVELDDSINQMAQNYAQYLAENNLFQHSNVAGYGENLYKTCSSDTPDISSSIEQATDSWYNEIKSYDWNNQGFTQDTGHFTQLVWRSTTTVGFGAAIGYDGSLYCIYVVGRYSPPGNYEGQFEDNVYPSRT